MTILDAVPETATPPPDPEVTVRRCRPDMAELGDEAAGRIATVLQENPAGCVYFNLAATVSWPTPSADFFGTVRKEQAHWCRQAGRTFPRSVRRRAIKWVGEGEWIGHKFARYLDRAVCFTRALFIGGRFVPPHRWPNAVTSSAPPVRPEAAEVA